MAADVGKVRVESVQAMRRAARECGVALIKDGFGRARVAEFARLVEASGGPAASKEAVAAAFFRYKGTWAEQTPAEAPTIQAQAPQGGFRLRGKSFLLTYNWDFLGRQQQNLDTDLHISSKAARFPRDFHVWPLGK